MVILSRRKVAHLGLEYLDYIVEIMILVSFYSVWVVKKSHRKILTIIHYIFNVYFFRSNIPWAGVGKNLYFALPAWYLDYGKYIFLRISLFELYILQHILKVTSNTTPFSILNVGKQIIVIEISLF